MVTGSGALAPVYAIHGEERVRKVAESEALDEFKKELQWAYDNYDPNRAQSQKAESHGPNWQTMTKDAEVEALEAHLKETETV